MGRYTTLTEEIDHYKSMAGITRTPQPCGCEKQDKEIITSSAMEESIDTDKYEDVVFLQDSEADEALSILDNDGPDMALEYLKSWHYYGEHMGSENKSHGAGDQTYEKDGYIMSWNKHLNYIGLQYEFSNAKKPVQKTHFDNEINLNEHINDPLMEKLKKINKFLLKK